MKKRTLALLLAFCMMVGVFAACGSTDAGAASGAEAAASVEPAASEEAAASAEPAPSEVPTPEPEPEAEPEASVEAPAEPEICTVTFSDGQSFEATVGEDFVFFFQCDAPGDMGEPEAGEEGAGITVSDGTVSYSNVGLGGPYQYPTSELVTISGFSGDFTVTITEAATFMDATYTIYTDEQEIADAIAFAEQMAAAQAANPMP